MGCCCSKEVISDDEAERAPLLSNVAGSSGSTSRGASPFKTYSSDVLEGRKDVSRRLDEPPTDNAPATVDIKSVHSSKHDEAMQAAVSKFHDHLKLYEKLQTTFDELGQMYSEHNKDRTVVGCFTHVRDTVGDKLAEALTVDKDSPDFLSIIYKVDLLHHSILPALNNFNKASRLAMDFKNNAHQMAIAINDILQNEKEIRKDVTESTAKLEESARFSYRDNLDFNIKQFRRVKAMLGNMSSKSDGYWSDLESSARILSPKAYESDKTNTLVVLESERNVQAANNGRSRGGSGSETERVEQVMTRTEMEKLRPSFVYQRSKTPEPELGEVTTVYNVQTRECSESPPTYVESPPTYVETPPDFDESPPTYFTTECHDESYEDQPLIEPEIAETSGLTGANANDMGRTDVESGQIQPGAGEHLVQDAQEESKHVETLPSVTDTLSQQEQDQPEDNLASEEHLVEPDINNPASQSDHSYSRTPEQGSPETVRKEFLDNADVSNTGGSVPPAVSHELPEEQTPAPEADAPIQHAPNDDEQQETQQATNHTHKDTESEQTTPDQNHDNPPMMETPASDDQPKTDEVPVIYDAADKDDAEAAANADDYKENTDANEMEPNETETLEDLEKKSKKRKVKKSVKRPKAE